MRNTNNRGDGRELYKTPCSLIELIVDSIIKERPDLKNRVWVDPCAGDGRWGDVIRNHGIKCLEYDICPLKKGIEKRDFFFSTYGDSNLFFIGNPPFSLIDEFVERGLIFSDCCYFLGGGRAIAGRLGHEVALFHRFEGYEGNQKDKRSKAWFLDTNNENVIIWCAGALFDRNLHKPFHISSEMTENSFAIGVHCFCEEDERVVALRRSEDDRCGKVRIIEEEN